MDLALSISEAEKPFVLTSGYFLCPRWWALLEDRLQKKWGISTHLPHDSSPIWGSHFLKHSYSNMPREIPLYRRPDISVMQHNESHKIKNSHILGKPLQYSIFPNYSMVRSHGTISSDLRNAPLLTCVIEQYDHVVPSQAVLRLQHGSVSPGI